MEEAIQQVEVTWGRAIKVWWSIKWRQILYMFALYAGIVAIIAAVGLVVWMVGVRPALAQAGQKDAPSTITSGEMDATITYEDMGVAGDLIAAPSPVRTGRAPFVSCITSCFMLLSMPIAFLIEIAVVKRVLRIRYSDFRIVLAKTGG